VHAESLFFNLASPLLPEAPVIGPERRMLLRHYLDTGMSKRAIARKLKISPDTLYRWIREGDLDRDLDAAPLQYAPRPSMRLSSTRISELISGHHPPQEVEVPS
jgi:transposase-like protein